MDHSQPAKAILLDRSDPEAMARASESQVALLEHGPNVVAVSLTGPNGAAVVRFECGPDGRITADSPAIPATYLYLPDPGQRGRIEPRNQLGLKRHLRDAALAAAAKEAAGPNNADDRDLVRALQRALPGWMRRIDRQLAHRIRGDTRYLEAQDRLRELLDQEAYNLAVNRKGNCLAERYNRAVGTKTAAAQVGRTNPAAAGWIMSNGEPDEMTHPGQAVARTRRELEAIGVERSHWRALSQLPEGVIEIFTEGHVASYLSAIRLNACGDARARINAQTAERAVALALGTRRRSARVKPPSRGENESAALARRNLRTVLRLYFQSQDGQPPDQPGAMGWADLMSLTDYVAAAIDEDQPIRSTAWTGLLRASDRWHGVDAVRRRNAANRAAIDRREGWVVSWNSLIDTVDIETPGSTGMEAVALTDERALMEEGDTLAHCVGGYGTMCGRGDSRIFSIRSGGQPLATVELRQRSGRWHPTQVRTVKNGVASAAVEAAARTTAGAYQREWEKRREREEPRHRGWMAQPDTGETKELPRDFGRFQI